MPRGTWRSLVVVGVLAAAALPARTADAAGLAQAGPEPPPGYYDPAAGLHGADLKLALHGVIDDHRRNSYEVVWTVLEAADEDPANPLNVLTVYLNSSVPKSSRPGSWNREHSWPTSHGFPDDGSCNYPYTDAHLLFAEDPGYNSSRSNLYYDYCRAGCTDKPVQGVPGAVNRRRTESWEVWPGRRGDVARKQLYVDLRYEGGTHGVTGCAEPELILTDDAALIVGDTSTNRPIAYMGMLAALLQWHVEDPVDDRERWRNGVVHERQGNRNPFVDHPEWVCDVWSGHAVCGWERRGVVWVPYAGNGDF